MLQKLCTPKQTLDITPGPGARTVLYPVILGCSSALLGCAEMRRLCCTGENPTRLVGMLIPEKALPDLLAELQNTEQGQQEMGKATPMRYVSDGPVKGSLRDIQ